MALKNVVPTVKLNSGFEIPMIGLGTWKAEKGVVEQTVKDAIDVGYRHLDCAFIYGNEAEVGSGIKSKIDEGVIKREQLFITSKVWNTYHSTGNVEVCCKESLKLLGLDYLDLYLIHWPFGTQEGGDLFPRDENGTIILSDVDYLDTWKGMEECVKKGLVKSIGISNFNSEQINRILSNCTIKPSMLQVECHPYLNQKKLIQFCKSKDIAFTAYSPFASPDRSWAKPTDPLLHSDERLSVIGKKYGKSNAQVILRWMMQQNLITIPKTVHKGRLIENLNVFDFELSSQEMEKIDSIHCNGRVVALEWCKNSKYYPFSIEF